MMMKEAASALRNRVRRSRQRHHPVLDAGSVEPLVEAGGAAGS
jgi:hypothetical protein